LNRFGVTHECETDRRTDKQRDRLFHSKCRALLRHAVKKDSTDVSLYFFMLTVNLFNIFQTLYTDQRVYKAFA